MNANAVNFNKIFFDAQSVYTASVIKSFFMHLTILFLVLLPIIAKQNREEERIIPIRISMVSVAAPNINQDLQKNSDKIKNLDAPVKNKPLKKEPQKELAKKPLINKKVEIKDTATKKQEIIPAKKSEFAELPKPASMRQKPKTDNIVKEKPKSQDVSEVKEVDYTQKIRESNITTKKQITANGKGNSVSNVMPTLTEADYLSTTPPIYPSRSIELGQQGTVIIRALISANGGQVQKVAIHKSSGFSMLDNSALDAVKDWKFKPFTSKSVPISGWVMVPVKFVIR